jgi:hypothetical protein
MQVPSVRKGVVATQERPSPQVTSTPSVASQVAPAALFPEGMQDQVIPSSVSQDCLAGQSYFTLQGDDEPLPQESAPSPRTNVVANRPAHRICER